MKVDLVELKRLMEKATPGPWKVWREERDGGGRAVMGKNFTGVYFAICNSVHGKTLEARDGNAEIIAALRNAAPALIAELEAARVIIDDCYKGIGVLRTMCKVAKLTGGQEASEQLLRRMGEHDPTLAPRSALRSWAARQERRNDG